METRTLQAIAKDVQACRRCRLYQTATRAVPGEGNPQAKLMFIGEGPGYYEDQTGRPFVGQAGKLLEKLLASIGLKREEVFIGNVIKHRPPDNRDPLPDEIEACRLWLDEQIEVIQPEVIVTLGRFSMAKFIPGVLISQVHGQPRYVDWNQHRLIIVPMYHPAAALRSEKVMQAIEMDFQKMKNFLNQPAKEEKKNDDSQNRQDGGGEQLGLL